MIPDQLKLFKPIVTTPHPRVELPQIQIQETSSGSQHVTKSSKIILSAKILSRGVVAKQFALNDDKFKLAWEALKA